MTIASLHATATIARRKPRRLAMAAHGQLGDNAGE
jgi:hypothetical protein